MSKMLFVQSKDYWGYDASSFDEAINFYKFTWVVPEAQYAKMDEEDQKRLYPCALFYVAGVTDNHNFLTLKITQEDDEAKVSGMEGTKRRTRRYEIGTPTQYSVGSYSLQAAPVAATTISEIQEAVEAGSTSEGSFTVSAFLNDANSVAEAVNYTEEKSAETFAAPSEVPSGSAYEPADPTVANPATAGYSESELITMDNFSAEEDEYLCKYCGQDPDATFADDFWDDGVCTPCAIEHGEYEDYEAEAYNGMFFAGGTLSYTTSFTRMIEGNHKINQPYKVSYEVISGNERYSELTNEHRLTFRNMIEKDIQEQIEEEGLIDITGEEILNGEIEYIGNNGQEVSIFYDATLMPSKVKSETILNNDIEEDVEIINFDAEGGRLRDIRGKFMNRRRAKNAVFGEVMSQQMSGYYRTGIVGDNPPVGQDISRRNPAAKAAYFLQPGVEDPNRPGSWSKGPNFQQARKIAKGVAWDTVQDMGLAAETFNADSIEDDREPIYQDCLVCGETQYMNDGGVYAYDDGTDQPICDKPACVSKWKQVEAAYDKGDDEGYKVYEKLFGADSLGAEDEAVLAHYANWSEDSTMLSGNGVPTYYGSAETFEAQSSTKEMNEAYKQYKMNLEKYVGFGDLWEKIHEESLRLQSQGLIAFDAWNEACKKFKVFDKLTKGVNMKHLREREKRYEPDSYYGNAESFEAPMARYSPGKGDVDRVLASLRSRYSGLQVKGTPIYMTMRSGSSNKYHVFVRTNKGNFNGYGRIGYAPTIHGPMSDSEYDRKLRAKQRPSKGYEETKYAEADYSPLAEAPSPYEPYSFMDEMTPNGEFITSDEFMELMSETLDGMSLRYEKPSMFGSPLAMGVGGVLVAALGYKLWSKRSDSTE